MHDGIGGFHQFLSAYLRQYGLNTYKNPSGNNSSYNEESGLGLREYLLTGKEAPLNVDKYFNETITQ